PKPKVSGGYVVWRSKYGPRKHEIVVPERENVARLWERTKVTAAAVVPYAPRVLCVGAPALESVLRQAAAVDSMTAEQFQQWTSNEIPDLIVVHHRTLADPSPRTTMRL